MSISVQNFLAGLSEFSVSQVAQRAIWSVIVVVLSPSFNLGSSIVQRQEPVFVQTLGANPSVERLDERVICRFAGTTGPEPST